MSSDAAGTRPSDRQSWWSRLLRRMRGAGVGTEDPNIVGDAGPYDVPPGRDFHPGSIPVSESGEPLPAEDVFDLRDDGPGAVDGNPAATEGDEPPALT